MTREAGYSKRSGWRTYIELDGEKVAPLCTQTEHQGMYVDRYDEQGAAFVQAHVVAEQLGGISVELEAGR